MHIVIVGCTVLKIIGYWLLVEATYWGCYLYEQLKAIKCAN